MLKKTILVLTTLSFIALTLACGWSRTKKGATIGGAAGGVVGAVIGDKAGNTAVGAIIGAAIGGAAGAWIGRYMDNQAREIEEDIAGAKVERVGEGIKITFDSGLMFAVDKSNLTSSSKAELNELATILNKYEDTNILLEGHTDASGSNDYNMDLSKRRAESVASQLAVSGVAMTRVTTVAYGEDQPIADNESAEGRQQNRRVEVAIYANEKLKKAAENQTSG